MPMFYNCLLKALENMKEEGKQFLQFVPIKEPRSNEVEILSKDPLIKGFDTSKFIFVDITFDATNQARFFLQLGI